MPADSDFLLWAVANPRTTDFDFSDLFMYGCGNLRSSRFHALIESFLHGFSFEHFSPTFSCIGMDDCWKLLVRASGTRMSLFFIVIPRITSRRTTLVHIHFWFFACKGFSSHWITLWIHFQSSVCVCACMSMYMHVNTRTCSAHYYTKICSFIEKAHLGGLEPKPTLDCS